MKTVVLTPKEVDMANSWRTAEDEAWVTQTCHRVRRRAMWRRCGNVKTRGK